MSPPTALIKCQNADVALMPPPPTKRTKRPSTVLDEDDYTDALSDIIARDFFPGVAEAKAQEEYLTALESNDDTWIREAGQRLREAATPLSNNKKRTLRDTRFDTARSWSDKTPVPDTPREALESGSETPRSTASGIRSVDEGSAESKIDTSSLSLSSFQAKYTSEDNESFNTVLDKQNNNRRKKHAYLWTSDQRIPSNRLLTHRAEQSKQLEAQSTHKALAEKHNEKALVPVVTGATYSRSASVDAWKPRAPNNNLMFVPDGIEESGLQTVMEARELTSKAGLKETVFANTRFPPSYLPDGKNNGEDSVPPSPSLNTTIIAARDARRAAKPLGSASTSVSDFTGSTPRVNGYAFVDEDEPSPVVEPANRNLLSGQASGDSSGSNPFQISEIRRREDLHLRLVAAKESARRKDRDRSDSGSGNMTPAARRLMHKLGTPVYERNASGSEENKKNKEMWTPGRTPRRKTAMTPATAATRVAETSSTMTTTT